MYPGYRAALCPGRKQSGFLRVILENLLKLFLWVSCTMLFLPIRTDSGIPILTLLSGIIILALQLALIRARCTGCYYYTQQCHLGWGKIASEMFNQESSTPKTSQLLSRLDFAFPFLFIIFGMTFPLIIKVNVTHYYVVLMTTILITVKFITGKKACGFCRMRFSCPARLGRKGC